MPNIPAHNHPYIELTQSPQRAPGRRRVHKVELDGQSYWVKWAEMGSRWNMRALHAAISPLLPIPLRCTAGHTGDEALRREAARLRQAAKAGIMVPKLIQQGKDYVVLEDAGAPLNPMLKHDVTAEDGQALMLLATDALNALHRAGLVHGRPHLKDMLVNASGEIVLVDFEEEPLAVMTLPQAQARDVWLWLASASKRVANDAALDALLATYLQTPPKGIRQALSALARSLKPMQLAMTKLRLTDLGSDLRQTSAATACLLRWLAQQEQS